MKRTTRANIPEFNPFDPEFLVDPYSEYERIRKLKRIHKTKFETWMITSFDLAELILKDSRFIVFNLPERLIHYSSSNNDSTFAHLSEIIDKWLFFVNPPDHTRLKRAILPSFTQQSIQELTPYISILAESMLEGINTSKSLDVIDDLATPLSSLTITRFLGLPASDAGVISDLCAEIVFLFDQPASLSFYKKQAEVLSELSEYLQRQIYALRFHPNEGLISFLLQQQESAFGLSVDEIISATILLAGTAQESTKGLIGNGLLALLQHPECLRYLIDEPHLLGSAVEELLRFDSPIQYITRKASENVIISDELIRAGEYVVIYLGAANRDPEVFPEPHQLRFDRQTKHLGFGAGLHYCVGSYLARLEMEIVLSFLLPYLQKYDVRVGKVERSSRRISRRLKSLPLEFIPK